MKKILSLVLASAMVASALAGCGSTKTAETQAPTTQASAETKAPEGSEAAPAETAAAAGTIEDGAKLVYWPMWAETEPQGQAISEAVDAFVKSTGIEV